MSLPTPGIPTVPTRRHRCNHRLGRRRHCCMLLTTRYFPSLAGALLGSQSPGYLYEPIRLPKGHKLTRVPRCARTHSKTYTMRLFGVVTSRCIRVPPQTHPYAHIRHVQRVATRGKPVVRAASGSQPDEEMIRAATQVDEMVREVFNELFISSSARYLLEGSPVVEGEGEREGNDSNELGGILSKVVSPRLDTMPAAVPAMIDQYLLALQSNYGSTSNDDIVKVLILLKEQILDLIESSMPAQVRDLQLLVDAQDSSARADLYSAMASSEELLESCSRLLRQLEEDTPMLDARLLLKLVVIRHELQRLAGDANAKNPFISMGKIPGEDLKVVEVLVAELDAGRRREKVEAYIVSEGGRPGRLMDTMVALAEESGEDAAQKLHDLLNIVVDVCEGLLASMPSSRALTRIPPSNDDDDDFRP
jgi:hypothetical protein